MLAPGKKEKLITQQIATAYAAIVFFHVKSPFESLLRSIKYELKFFGVRKGKTDATFRVLRELLWKL